MKARPVGGEGRRVGEERRESREAEGERRGGRGGGVRAREGKGGRPVLFGPVG